MKQIDSFESYIFSNCKLLRVIYVEDGCMVDTSNINIPDSVKVGPPFETLMQDVHIWKLREQKHIVIPRGVVAIGNYWFWGCDIESIEIPSSVREIGVEAFCNCRKLKQVVFAKGSWLEKIGERSFKNTGIEELALPETLEDVA